MKTSHKLLFQNAKSLKVIPSQSIDLVVTSPPYPMISIWDEAFSSQDPKIKKALDKNDGNTAFERMHQLLDPVWQELFRVLKNGAMACINIGDAVRTLNDNFCLYQNHSRIMKSLLDAGFSSLPAIIWRKQTNAPNKFMGSGMLPAGAYVTLEHEYILVLRKKGKREFIKEEQKQKRRESAFFWEERNLWFSDVWMDLKGASQSLFNKTARDRSGAFPFELPYRLINMFSVKEDTVLDPFLGMGTTAFAAMASARNSIGVEYHKAFNKDFLSKLQGIVPFSNHRIAQRMAGHLEFVKNRKKENKPLKYENIPYAFPVVTRQEKHLFFNEVQDTQKINDTHFEVTYSDDPHSALDGYWGELFRKQ